MTSLDQVWEALESQETFWAWLAYSSDSFKRELEMYGRHLKAALSKSEDSEGNGDEEDGLKEHPKDSSRFFAPAYFRRLCMKIYVHVSHGSFKCAEVLIKKAEKLLELCVDRKFIGSEHQEGYNYVLGSLRIYFSLSKEGESWDEEKVTSSVKSLKSYDKLCDKSKAAVLSVKSYFYGNIYSDSYEQQIAVCRQVSFIGNF